MAIDAVQTVDVIALEAQALRERIAGDVVLPQDPNWDEARMAWNLEFDQRPAAVAIPETAADVVEIVRFARSRGLKVAPQSTGHNAGPMKDALADAVLLKTHKMRSVRIDPTLRRACIQAGATWIEVVEPAAKHGLAPLSGSSHDVGVLGYILGGGLSFLSRKHGLAANSVTAIEVVTADGRVVETTPDNEPDLFWALRGGGGNFGVVTQIEIELYPVSGFYAGHLLYPQERAAEVLKAWRELVPSMPDEMTTVGRILNIPPIPEVPEFLQGRSFVAFEAIYLGDEAEGARLIQPMRDLGPEIDMIQPIPLEAISYVHMDPPHPVPGLVDHLFLGDLTEYAIDSLVAAAGPGTGSPLVSIEIRHLEGELGRTSPDSSAFGSVDARFVMMGVGMTPTPELRDAVAGFLPRLVESLAAYDTGRGYFNFTEHAVDGGRLYEPAVYRRLRGVKAQYDPDELFRANHRIPPAH
jgi:FAD/FMN-containing dehydrogenase